MKTTTTIALFVAMVATGCGETEAEPIEAPACEPIEAPTCEPPAPDENRLQMAQACRIFVGEQCGLADRCAQYSESFAWEASHCFDEFAPKCIARWGHHKTADIRVLMGCVMRARGKEPPRYACNAKGWTKRTLSVARASCDLSKSF